MTAHLFTSRIILFVSISLTNSNVFNKDYISQNVQLEFEYSGVSRKPAFAWQLNPQFVMTADNPLV